MAAPTLGTLLLIAFALFLVPCHSSSSDPNNSKYTLISHPQTTQKHGHSSRSHLNNDIYIDDDREMQGDQPKVMTNMDLFGPESGSGEEDEDPDREDDGDELTNFSSPPSAGSSTTTVASTTSTTSAPPTTNSSKPDTPVRVHEETLLPPVVPSKPKATSSTFDDDLGGSGDGSEGDDEDLVPSYLNPNKDDLDELGRGGHKPSTKRPSNHGDFGSGDGDDEDDYDDDEDDEDLDIDAPELSSSTTTTVRTTTTQRATTERTTSERPTKKQHTKKPTHHDKGLGGHRDKSTSERPVVEDNDIGATRFPPHHGGHRPTTPLYDEDDHDENRLGNDVSILGHKNSDKATSFFAQPGILAAVIGGAVVGLLCAILLVMFIVYRMRKKDEGSYSLDEPKRSSHAYARASTGKEFYA